MTELPGVPPTLITPEIAATVAHAEWVTVFSGAGMSAESGIPTFRDAQTGLWEHFDAASLATVDAWDADPALVWGWYQWRARLASQAAPNAGHYALAALSDAGSATTERSVMIVTQNVDDLHERASTPVLSHLHGSLFAPRCARCCAPYALPTEQPADIAPDPIGEVATAPDLDTALDALRIAPPECRYCGGLIRPGIVWFGEHLPEDAWSRAENAFRAADVVIVVGTSGIVYPAASLPERAAREGVPVIEVNPEPSALTPIASHRIAAGAATALPALVAAINNRG